MGDLASLWDYQEHSDMDQLGEKLLCTTLELEKLKAEAREEMRKNKEDLKQLIHLLQLAIQERDEAKNQLRKLLNTNNMSLTNVKENFSTLPPFQVDTPVVKQVKTNSSITESNSLSETYNYTSHGTSPMDSFFDAVSSPEFPNINMISNQPLVQDSNVLLSTNNVASNVVPKVDHGSLVIDSLVKGRVLPEKGKFLQSVLEAGPLLQTLLLAGPLPTWRNPPQLQPFQIPPVSIKGCEAEMLSQKASNVGNVCLKTLNLQPYAQMSCGSAQVQSVPMLNFSNVTSGTCLRNSSPMLSGVNVNGYVRSNKRQRFC